MGALKKYDSLFLSPDAYDEDTHFRNIKWQVGWSAHRLLEVLDTAGGRRGKPVRDVLMQWKAQVTARRKDAEVEQDLVAAINNEYCKPSKFQAYISAASGGVATLLDELSTDEGRGDAPLQSAIASGVAAAASALAAAVGDMTLADGSGLPRKDDDAETEWTADLYKQKHGRFIYDACAICESGIIPDLRGKVPNSLSQAVGKDPPCFLCPDSQRDFDRLEQVDMETFKAKTGSMPSAANVPAQRGYIVLHPSYKCPCFRGIVKSYLLKNLSKIGKGVFKALSYNEYKAREAADCKRDGVEPPGK